MIKRVAEAKLLELCKYFPIVTLTGPRQSGKTTLCRMALEHKPYVSLEAPDVLEFASEDTRGFIKKYKSGAVIDEVQRFPPLLSYLQVEVDEQPEPGRFVLTGSSNLNLLQSVSQSLAGRTGLLELLPCSQAELRLFKTDLSDIFSTMYSGCYPAIYDRNIPVPDWYSAYVGTYVERDVRQILNVSDISSFRAFLKLMAGRTGQLLNFSQIGSDLGLSHNTVKAWVSVLESSYIAFRMQPFFRNLNTRLIKTPKMHFYDTGLVCFMLGIESPDQLATHPLRGAIFESWAVSEILKTRIHLGLRPHMVFYRDQKGNEVDLLIETGSSITAVEIKSGQTVNKDMYRKLVWLEEFMRKRLPHLSMNMKLVYSGNSSQTRNNVEIIPWSGMDRVNWASTGD